MTVFFEYLPSFKLTVSDQKGKSISRELKDNDANILLGLQVGQETDASILGLQGKIKITGGSDKSGVAMRGDVAGIPRKRVLLSKGVGLQDVKKGLRKRKLVREHQRKNQRRKHQRKHQRKNQRRKHQRRNQRRKHQRRNQRKKHQRKNRLT